MKGGAAEGAVLTVEVAVAKGGVDKRRLAYSNVAVALAVGGAVVEVAVEAVVAVDGGVAIMCMVKCMYAWSKSFRTDSSQVHSENASRKVYAALPISENTEIRSGHKQQVIVPRQFFAARRKDNVQLLLLSTQP